MALINCPECGKEISDKAVSCPNCGMPLDKMEIPKEEALYVSNCAETDTNGNEPFSAEQEAVNGGKINTTNIIISVVISVVIFAIVAGALFWGYESHKRKNRIESSVDAVVKITCLDAWDNEVCTGSGFFYRDCNHVVTNYHVIEDAFKINVITNDDRQFETSIVFYASKEMDLAVLALDSLDAEYPTLEPSKKDVSRGDKVYAIGSPLGIKNTMSEGIISGSIVEDGMNVIQTTAPISAGSSGGALINSDGYVVGITYASYYEGQNLNLAIPIKFLEEACPGPLWKNSLRLTPPQFFARNHAYGEDLHIARLLNSDLEPSLLSDIKKNYDAYEGKTLVFQAVVSSVFDDEGALLYFLSDGIVSNNWGEDISDYDNNGIRRSDFVVVRVRTSDYNHVDAFKPGEVIWVVGWDDDDENDILTPLIMYDEDNEKYISFMQNVLNELKGR